ncbi:CopG family transcriptional regulator [Candidatus Pacearchaeota archaeon]|nr:CopG family transcriptional regulator [Candidatus Pacearchaeota archaeon]
MKERASFTFDKETIKVLNKLINSGKYRNRSHAVEEAVKLLLKKEKEGGENE